MKTSVRIIWCLISTALILILPMKSHSEVPQGIVTGKVTDGTTGNPIPGATIYIPDLKRGAITDKNGVYIISNLPDAIIKVQVTCVGYQMIVEVIDVAVTKDVNFKMMQSVAELSEFVVTGISQAGEKNKVPTPITTIPSVQLLEISSTNIIGALATQPGISQITTGASISKPVIRGLGFNRVLVVNDGIRQEGQQWGEEHGVEIDEFSVHKVEILKGPSSLMYGSDAMAGVINFLTAPTLPAGTIEGKFLANYQTNNGLFGYSLNVAGNKKDFTWDLRWSNKMAHAYKNKYDGYVLNSGFSDYNLGGIAGINKSWGYSHIHFSMYHLKPGIVEGERDSLTGNFVTPVAMNDTTENLQQSSDDKLTSYNVLTPYQKVNHYKVVLNNNLLLGNGSLKAIVGWQQNQRKEFGDVLNPDDYGLYFLLNTVNYDFRYVFPDKNNYNFSMGLNGMFQTSQNKGTEFLVPEYRLFDIGMYAILSKSVGKLNVSGGLRYDLRTQQGDDLFLDSSGIQTDDPLQISEQRFYSFDEKFTGVSGSLGATYELSRVTYTKLNVSGGFRAPNIAELGSNGEHEGSGRYEIGDPSLKAEQSLQWDFTFGVNSDHVTGEVNLFYNTIDNFIFISRLSGYLGGDSLIDDMQVHKYAADRARLAGGEISIDIHPHPLDWLHFENTFSYVEGIRLNQPDSAKYLPSIPAPKFSSELKATSKKLSQNLMNAYVNLVMDYTFEQDKIYAVNETETITKSYFLINLGAGTDIVFRGKTWLSLYFSVNNLFDKAYQNHLSRLKYAPTNYATGRNGVFEMGRNFSIKAIVPLRFSGEKKQL